MKNFKYVYNSITNKTPRKRITKDMQNVKKNMLVSEIKNLKFNKMGVPYPWTGIVNKATCNISPKLTCKFSAILNNSSFSTP